MKSSTLPLLLLLLLPVLFIAPLHAEPLSPRVLERYEGMLLKNPEPGTAFDKVYQHYQESEGLEALAQHWTEASQKDTAHRMDYLLLLGLLADQRGEAGDAVKNLRAAAEGGQGWRAWSALASVEARDGKLKDAVKDYQKALAENPPRDALAEIYRSLALCQQRLMDFDGAVETWQSYAKASPENAFVLEEAGNALLEAGRFDEARSMFVRLRALKEADPAVRLKAALRLGEVERQRGDKDASLKIYTEALAEAGTSSWLQREVRARIEHLFRSGDDLPGLMKYYQKRLKTEPGDLEAALSLSEVLVELNRQDESLKVLQTAAEKAPDNKAVQLKLATALLRAGHPDDAERVLSALLKAFPDDIAVTEKLGEAQWQSFVLGKGSKDAALATWRKLAPVNASPSASAVQHLAEIFRAHDLSGEALVEYRRALALDPAANDRRQHLAEYLMALDRKEEAMKEVLGFVADGRASGENYLRLAKIQRRFGDNAAARRSLEAAAQFPDRAFERQYLAWQIASEEKAWDEAEKLAMVMRTTAASEPEIERADECLVRVFHEQQKTGQEITDLLERRKTAPEAFTERDWRLLFALAINADDNGTAEFALTEGLAQFPKSAALSKFENALARRDGDTARQIAALQRLEQIEPRRAGDWMAERVRAYRDAEQWDEAIQLAQQCVRRSPAAAGTHLLLADTFLAAQRPKDAIRVLNDAVRLSEDPNQIRLRLAELYQSQGHFAEARETLDEAFDAEETPSGKLRLTARLATAYLQEGRIRELIAKMRARQKAEEGGWHYALYLAEIYQMLGDSAHAMTELDKALMGNPNDPILLKRLRSLAETTGNTAAVLRYARRIAAVEPTPQNRALLGGALVNDGKLDESLALLKAHSDEFLEDPTAWREVVRALQDEKKTAGLTALLEGRLRADPNDWRSLMVMAEILMGMGQTDDAANMLWHVMDITKNAASQAQPAPTPAAGKSTAVVRSGRIVHYPPSYMRQMRFNKAHQRAVQILTNQPGSSHVLRMYQGAMPSSGGATSLEDAQDDALVYLGCLAIRDGSEEEFVKKLPALLSDHTVEERLAIANSLQCPGLLVHEIEAYLDSSARNEKTSALVFQSLQSLLARTRSLGSRAKGGISAEKLKSLQGKLDAEIDAGTLHINPMQRYAMLTRQKRQEEANKLADEILAAPDSDDRSLLTTAFWFATQRKNYDRAIEINEKLKAAYKKQGASIPAFQNFSLASVLLTSDSDSDREKGIDLLAENFLSSGPGGAGMMFGWSGQGRQQTAWPQLRGGNLKRLVPRPTRELNRQQIAILRNMTRPNSQFAAAVPDLIKHFSTLAKSENSQTLEQATLWLLWFSGEETKAKEAMKVLLEEKPSDALLINYSMMLATTKHPAEALKALDQIQARSGDTHELALRLRFVLALDSKDDAAAKDAALKLAKIHLLGNERSQLAQEMKRLGMKDQVAQLLKKPAPAQNPAQRTRQMVELMNAEVKAGNHDEALPLIHAILGRDPFSPSARNEHYQQNQALRALKKFGELDAYIADLKEKLQAAPDSQRLNAQMATALQIKDPKLAEPYYRKLAELRPNDVEWLDQLGRLLVQAKQNEEAMLLYERILAKDPEQLFARGTNFIAPFRNTKSWQRLADAIEKLPDRVTNPLSRNRRDYTHVFTEIARNLQRAHPPVDPTGMWLKALHWSSGNSWQIRPAVAYALMQAGRTDEARKVIEEAFFPPEHDGKPIQLFVYSRQFQSGALWNQTMSYGSGKVESAAMRMLQTAASMGFLKELMPRIEKLPAPGNGIDPKLMVRLVAHDERALPEIRKRLKEAKAAKPGSPVFGGMQSNNLRILADALADWPQARKLAPEALDAAARVCRVQNNIYALPGIYLQGALLAMEDDDTARARKALGNWIEANRNIPQQGHLNFTTGLSVLRMMMAADMEDEAQELLDTLRASPNIARNTYYQRRLTDVETELAFLAGKGGTVTPVVVWTPGADGEGSLCWDLQPGSRSPDDEKTVWMAQEPLDQVSGKYTLEVYFGETQSSMKRLFRKADVPARGSWSGKLPAGQGWLRATLLKGGEKLTGPAVVAATGTSLLAPDSLNEILNTKNGRSKSWVAIPPVWITQKKGGPAGDGKFLRLDGLCPGSMELTAERIPLDPNKNYLLGGWFRYHEGRGSARLHWRIYDAAGKELSDRSANGRFRGDRWNYAVIQLGNGSNSVKLPKTAAWLEPYVQFNNRCDLQGIHVTEVKSKTAE